MKNLLLTGFVALGLLATSCSDNDEVIDQGGDGLNGYLTLALKSPTLTKTDDYTPGREAGTGDEIKINDVTVVLTNASDVITQIVTTSMQSVSSTQEFSVAAGTHKVYALVNASGISTGVSVGQSIETVISNAVLADITSGFKGGSFFMTNERHSGQSSAGVDVTIAAGDHKVAAVTVDRAAAKIVDETTTPTIGLDADTKAVVDGVEVLGFVPLNLNADFNLIQTWGTANGGGTVAEDVLQTPVTHYLAPVTDYKTKQTVGTVSVWENKSGISFVDSVYTTENRPPITVNAQGVLTAQRNNTTGVIYKVQAKKADVNCGTFYAYNGKAYTDLSALSSVYGTDLTGKSVLELRALGINVYEDGIMYYTYFVRDPNTNYQLGSKDYFGVFRNSVYRLNITTIASLGDDVPDDNKNPGETIDPDDAYLKVELTVNDWVLNNINIQF